MIASIFLMKVSTKFLNSKSWKLRCPILQNGSEDQLKRGRREPGYSNPKRMSVGLFSFFMFACLCIYSFQEPNHIDIAGNFQIIRIDMKLANEDVSMLAFTSEQITAPFLLPEMVVSFPFFRTKHFYS